MTEMATRLQSVRAELENQGLDALFVPRADEFLGEYIPDYNERMCWISGFTGSAGMVLVAREAAAVFVDGRYTVQVRQQVDESLFDIEKLEEGAATDWLKGALPGKARVGVDPRLHTRKAMAAIAKSLQTSGIEIVAIERNPIDVCWLDRPQADVLKALLLSERYTGESSASKRARIGGQVEQLGADKALIFAPDSVAWLLNIRGRDIPSLPIVLGHALLDTKGNLELYADPGKIPEGFDEHVGDGVRVRDLAELEQALQAQSGQRVLVDPDTANAWCQMTLEQHGATLVSAQDPVIMPKACKNAVEVDGMRAAHLRDGVAEVQFLAWLDREVAAGKLHDEAALSDQLFVFRSAQEDFQEVSFSTISAAGGNAAMCHYNHLNGEPARLELNSVYLVDSGGQYLDGTTDITRTVAIGAPDDEIKRMFTLVLKGHIALDQARFPVGTTGTQLDVLARQFLWQEGLDYDHGTGHGVGAFLSVHEGPQRIGKQHNATALNVGMIISNEPGYYKTDRYGIRCENLVVVTELQRHEDPDAPSMLGFEAITLAPFDLRMVDDSLLDQDERRWLNEYHDKVRESISPFLNEADQAWLADATRVI